LSPKPNNESPTKSRWRFIWDHTSAEDDLHAAELRAHMGPEATDETVDQLAEWIVDQGIDAYDAMLEDISKAPNSMAGQPDDGLRRIAQRRYRERFRTAVQLSGSPLWDLIDIGRKDPAAFERKLKSMKEEQLVELYWSHARAMQYLYEAGLRNHMGGAASDFHLESLAEWIVDQGKDYWNDALDDLSRAPRKLSREQEGGLRQLIAAIYRKRFDADVRFPDDPPP
jgi:hypothetical protein